MIVENPHDKIFKGFQSIKENAIDFIRGTFPKELLNNLNIESLKLDNNSYISKELEESFADIVYECDYQKDVKIKIALLFEHKSCIEKYPHIQLLKYFMGIWSQNIKANKSLQIIVPIIFYHGKKEWELREFKDYFAGVDTILQGFIPHFTYLLTDLSHYDEEEIRNRLFQRESTKIFLLVMKSIFNVNYLVNNLSYILGVGKDYYLTDEGADFLETIIRYLLSTTEITTQSIIDNIKKTSDKGGNIVMTTAAKLMKEGREEGLEQGLTKGKLEGKLEDAKSLKTLGVEIDIISKATGLSEEEIKKL